MKIEMHKLLYPTYAEDLLLTAIVVNSEHVKSLINGVFKMLYTPCRPVRIVTTPDDMVAFAKMVHSGECTEMYTSS